MKTEELYLSLGSNMGDFLENLLAAVVGLGARGIRIDEVSGIYRTEPVGFTAQDDFLNMVVKGGTPYGPHKTLEVCHEVENVLGRVREQRWGPRTIDIDILFYGGLSIMEKDLQVPHPRLGERAFVLVPLKEVAPSKFRDLGFTIPRQKVYLKIGRTDVTMMLREKGLAIG